MLTQTSFAHSRRGFSAKCDAQLLGFVRRRRFAQGDRAFKGIAKMIVGSIRRRPQWFALLLVLALALVQPLAANGATSMWTPFGSLAYARYEHTATLLPDGRVLVAGGGTIIGTAELTRRRLAGIRSAGCVARVSAWAEQH